MNTVVFDLEIYESIGSEVEGVKLTFDDTDALGVSVLAAWSSATDTFMVYGGEDMQGVKDMLQKADAVVSYNGANFDLPCLLGASKADWRRNPLNYIDGVEAHSIPRLWREGQWTTVVNHCLRDVCLTRDLHAFVLKNGYVIGKDGKKLKVPGRLFTE